MSISEINYFYLPLRDAKKSLNMKINIMAKVFKFGKAVKSRGSDYFLVLKLLDQYESPPGLSMNLFSDDIDKLPQVRCIGDIISLHHVEVKVNNGEFYGTYNGRLSSFALFDGESVMEWSPYQTSINYQASCCYKKLLLHLRTNTEGQPPEHELVEPLITLFCNLKAEEKLSIVSKVLHVNESSDGDLVLFLWDATDCPHVTLQTDLDLEGRTQTPLHPKVSLLPRKALCTFPQLGTIVTITVSKDFKCVSLLKGVGYWVKLCNVIFEVQSGLWKGALTPSTCVHILSDEDNNVQNRQRILNDRISSNVDCLPFSVFPQPSDVTETDTAYSSYSTLMESLTCPEVIHKSRTIVRVVASYPWRAMDLRASGSGKYRIRLTIEDSTARIHAYIYEEDGVRT